MNSFPSTRSTERRRTTRGMTLLTIAVVAALGYALGLAPPREAGADASAGPYMYFAGHSGKVLDVPDGDVPGTRLFQWQAHGGDNQRFMPLTFATVGDIHLVILQSAETGNVVEVADGPTGPGTAVAQAPWSGAAGQVWWQARFGDTGYVLFVNMASGQVLEVEGASQSNGAAIIQWPWHGGLNQLWSAATLVP